jgi:hypothetical protein
LEITTEGSYGSSIYIKYGGREIYFGYGTQFEMDVKDISRELFLDLMSKLYDMAEVK